jgi:quercetin dioxygenase-like cupin family protein
MRAPTTTRPMTAAGLVTVSLTLAACAATDTGPRVADAGEAGDASTEAITDDDGEDGTNPAGHRTDPTEGDVPEPPAPGEPITPRAEFTDDVGIEIRSDVDGRDEEVVDLMDDASRFVVAEFVIEPGQQFPWHTHPGPVLINVAEADDDAFVFTFGEDCQQRTYSAGEALVDPGGAYVATGSSNVHTARNDGDRDIRVVAVILGADAEEPLTIPADPAEAAALDAACDVTTPGHGDGH